MQATLTLRLRQVKHPALGLPMLPMYVSQILVEPRHVSYVDTRNPRTKCFVTVTYRKRAKRSTHKAKSGPGMNAYSVCDEGGAATIEKHIFGLLDLLESLF